MDADEQISSSAVDDILLLFPVEMIGGILPFREEEQFFRVSFRVFFRMFLVSVSECDQGHTDPVKISLSIVRNVKPQTILPYFIKFMAFTLPLLRGEGAERGKRP